MLSSPYLMNWRPWLCKTRKSCTIAFRGAEQALRYLGRYTIASPSPIIDSFLSSMTKSPFAGATALITIKKNCCPYPSMSSCAASSCMSFPKALSAFATLASSPTGAAPLSCRFALNYSEQYSHRRPNQKLSLLRNRARAHSGSVPSVAERW